MSPWLSVRSTSVRVPERREGVSRTVKESEVNRWLKGVETFILEVKYSRLKVKRHKDLVVFKIAGTDCHIEPVEVRY